VRAAARVHPEESPEKHEKHAVTRALQGRGGESPEKEVHEVGALQPQLPPREGGRDGEEGGEGEGEERRVARHEVTADFGGASVEGFVVSR